MSMKIEIRKLAQFKLQKSLLIKFKAYKIVSTSKKISKYCRGFILGIDRRENFSMIVSKCSKIGNTKLNILK